MQINWPLVILVFCLSLPGTFIAIPRLIHLLLPNNSEELRARISRLAVVQTLIMVLLMSLAGAVLSLRTGLKAPILEALLLGQPALNAIQNLILPVFLYTLGGLFVFLILYYAVVESILDEQTLNTMRKIRSVLRPDGCILYGGVVEEVLARWGLMNVLVFFSILFLGRSTPILLWGSIFLSGLFFGFGQLPTYLAAGCQPSRRFIYVTLLLNLWQGILFGWLFWQYGLLAAIVSHMLFHLGWSLYDKA
ncbi:MULTISPECIES: CPBP family glutamic-type intramembrane protease [Legionella]|uniref:CAAX amino terminal protease self-immunity n=1 Tax=Legionella drozanskii LLAP-1 TaxID=1212489 RepID=A0A0W0SWX9_9GAMM|nr:MULTISPECIES: CPBP family glutamic-type intramembrane protease [Legionella]KTC87870.1 CAAX amino terminal protease self- immunity [Legionella drozanskii LLAP-1]PJE09091.1 MAG: CPBP family intramembrane metalloprotease [Legionella sp.]